MATLHSVADTLARPRAPRRMARHNAHVSFPTQPGSRALLPAEPSATVMGSNHCGDAMKGGWLGDIHLRSTPPDQRLSL